jgi:competence CoiA-like predicted nuclease
MVFAIINGEKEHARPDMEGNCPLCDARVFSRCGEINAPHWAHFKDEGCESWYEPETDWHFHWKMVFGKNNAEVVIEKE